MTKKIYIRLSNSIFYNIGERKFFEIKIGAFSDDELISEETIVESYWHEKPDEFLYNCYKSFLTKLECLGLDIASDEMSREMARRIADYRIKLDIKNGTSDKFQHDKKYWTDLFLEKSNVHYTRDGNLKEYKRVTNDDYKITVDFDFLNFPEFFKIASLL